MLEGPSSPGAPFGQPSISMDPASTDMWANCITVFFMKDYSQMLFIWGRDWNRGGRSYHQSPANSKGVCLAVTCAEQRLASR